MAAGTKLGTPFLACVTLTHNSLVSWMACEWPWSPQWSCMAWPHCPVVRAHWTPPANVTHAVGVLMARGEQYVFWLLSLEGVVSPQA